MHELKKRKGRVGERGNVGVEEGSLRNKSFDAEDEQRLFECSKDYVGCDFFGHVCSKVMQVLKSDSFLSLSVPVWCSDPAGAQRHLYHWAVTATHIHEHTNT